MNSSHCVTQHIIFLIISFIFKYELSENSIVAFEYASSCSPSVNLDFQQDDLYYFL